MKKLKEIKPDLEQDGKKYYEEITIKKAILDDINEILKRHPKVKLSDIMSVGIVDTGELQFAVPTEISNIGIIKLVGFIKWFADFKEGDFK